MSLKSTPKKIDAILVAGEGESSYKVYNQHKAFLKVEGKCIINYVIETLQKSDSINEIYVVGSKESLSNTLEESGIDFQNPKPIHLVDQRANLFENIWNTFLYSIGAKEGDDGDSEGLALGLAEGLALGCGVEVLALGLAEGLALGLALGLADGGGDHSFLITAISG